MVNYIFSKINVVNVVGIFSKWTDEVIDISRKEQFCLCVWYVKINNLKLREDFLKRIPVTN
jgi:hypothetical protein